MILEQPPMAPSDLCRDFPRGLETIILNCLEKNPANRYATAQQLIHDLLRFTRGHRIRRTRSNWLSAGVHRLRNLFR
jgi:serine/threonine protein kinase